MNVLTVCLVIALLAHPAVLIAQTTTPRETKPATGAVDRDAAAIGRGWSAIGVGNTATAIAAADEVLRRSPRHHGAVELKIEATVVADPIGGLDVYEMWLGQGAEDIFLLAPIARSTLRQLAAGSDNRLQMEALRHLAAAGDASASQKLDALRATSGLMLDLLAAREGDEAAARRLLASKDASGIRPQAFAEALPAAGAPAIPRLLDLLKNPDAPVRAAAALGLGTLGAAAAVEPIRELMKNDRMNVAFLTVALARLGDAEAAGDLQDFLQSPSPEMRLLAAQVYAAKGRGAWVDAITPLLEDPNGLTRIRAAEILQTVEPDRARAVLAHAAADPNPVVRADVARIVAGTADDGPADLKTLRRMLRDSDASVRGKAAGLLIRAAR